MSMYILFNQDGSLKATNLADFIVKGENNQKSIFIGIEGLTEINDLVAEVDAKLPADGVDPIAITCESDSQTIDGHLYYGWTLPITANLTAYEGIVYASLIVTDEIANTTFVTYNFKLVINPSVIAPDDAEVNISIAQYRLLLSALNQKRNLETFPLSVYAVDESGNQTTYNLDTANMPDGEVVKRGDNQEIWVRNNPTQDYEAIHKKYADDNFLKIYSFNTSTTLSTIYDTIPEKPFILYTSNIGHYYIGRIQNPAGRYTFEFEELVDGTRYLAKNSDQVLGITTLSDALSNTYRADYALKKEVTHIYKHTISDLGINYKLIVYSTDGTDYSGQVYVNSNFTIYNLIKNALRVDLEGYLSSDSGKNMRHLTFDGVSGGGGAPLTITFTNTNVLYGTTATNKQLCAADISIEITDVVTEL